MYNEAISSLEFCFNMYCYEYHEVFTEAKKLYIILLLRAMVFYFKRNLINS